MKIRPFKDGDLVAVADLFTAAVHRLAEPHYDPVQRVAWAPRPPDLSVWRNRLDGLPTLVAEDRDSLVGFITYQHDGHIDMLFTSPAHMRHGVASLLYRHVENELAAIGKTELTTEASLIARPFFERHGFQVVDQQIVTLRGTVFRRFTMVRRGG